MRPSSSSSPQSPQVEPAGRCFHRFVTAVPLAVDRRSIVPIGPRTDRSSPAVRKAHRMTQKDFVVSADGHLLEPTDLFRTRLPKHLRDRARLGGGLRDRAARRGRRPDLPASCTRRGTRAGRSPATARPAGGCPKAIPSIILEDMDLDGVDVQVMHPNLSLFGLYSDDHELSMAHARVYNDYVDRAVHAVLLAPRAHRARSRSPTSTTRSPRSSASPPAGSARSSCPRPRRSRTTRATSTRCGPRPRPTACTCSSTRRPAA